MWKVIAADRPLGLKVGNGVDTAGQSRWSGDGNVLGREFEIAHTLPFIKHERVKNVVWVTADVHYCAAHYYDPDKAPFQDFEPL